MTNWRLHHDFIRLFPVLDPLFDDMGDGSDPLGGLTLSQIQHPLPAVIGYDHDIMAIKRRRRERQRRYYWRQKMARLSEQKETAFRNNLNFAKARLMLASARLFRQGIRDYPKFQFKGNRKCDGCIPYNGSHTANYWKTGQKDPW